MDLRITAKVVAAFRGQGLKKGTVPLALRAARLSRRPTPSTRICVWPTIRRARSGARTNGNRTARLQLAFLISEGLRRDTRLLDMGCGVGRFARKVVPYLEPGRYTGVDISAAALEHALVLSEQEGWAAKRPRLLLNGDLEIRGHVRSAVGASVSSRISRRSRS